MRYVALLRGINVGGNNPVRMSDLKACLVVAGFTDVTTYINSGNVIFDTQRSRRDVLTSRVERMLHDTFDLPIAVVLRTRDEMTFIVKEAPKGFGSRPDEFRYDVAYLKEPLLARDALKDVPTKDGVDRIWPGKGVLYMSRLTARASQSATTKMIGTPSYKLITIRNWNTTLKILSMLER